MMHTHLERSAAAHRGPPLCIVMVSKHRFALLPAVVVEQHVADWCVDVPAANTTRNVWHICKLCSTLQCVACQMARHPPQCKASTCDKMSGSAYHPAVQSRAEYSSSSPMNRYGSSGSKGTSCMMWCYYSREIEKNRQHHGLTSTFETLIPHA